MGQFIDLSGRVFGRLTVLRREKTEGSNRFRWVCRCEIEVLAKPADLEEWIDVVILALDGAWRAGYFPEEIIAALKAKQAKNELRQWPDWRTAEPGKAIEHVRDGEPCGHPGCLSHVSHPCEGCGRVAGRAQELEKTCMNCGTVSCDHQTTYSCKPNHPHWRPQQ